MDNRPNRQTGMSEAEMRERLEAICDRSLLMAASVNWVQPEPHPEGSTQAFAMMDMAIRWTRELQDFVKLMLMPPNDQATVTDYLEAMVHGNAMLIKDTLWRVDQLPSERAADAD